jgi:hypothetical protein
VLVVWKFLCWDVNSRSPYNFGGVSPKRCIWPSVAYGHLGLYWSGVVNTLTKSTAGVL